LHAGCSVSLPRAVQTKKVVVNISRDNNECSFWSVVASLYPVSTYANRISSYSHYSSVLCNSEIQLPMTLKQVGKFGKRNNISINVYGWIQNTCVPLHLTSEKKDRHANLLLIENLKDPSRHHFAWIRNMSRLISKQINNKQHARYICDRLQEKLDAHLIDYSRMNDCAIILPAETDKWLRFKNYRYKERAPFIVYADLECFLEDVTPKQQGGKTSSLYQHHRAFSVGYYVHCTYDASLCRYHSYGHESECIEWFAKELYELGST
ncbi:hypothetical protein WN55_04313, partial [Dufourea novaeangliae]